MSTQPTFTSGPWAVRHATDVVALHQPEGSRHVADCDPYHLPIDHPRWEQESANALLIAAAPDLLAALVALRDNARLLTFARKTEATSDLAENIARASAAIAKATEGR